MSLNSIVRKTSAILVLASVIGGTTPALAQEVSEVRRDYVYERSAGLQERVAQLEERAQNLEDRAAERLEDAFRRTDEIIVKYKGEETFRRVRVPAGQNIDEELRRYRSRGNIEYAESNFIAYKQSAPNDPYYRFQWNLENSESGSIHVEDAWSITTGNGVVVAVIDTGVAYEDHRDGGTRFEQAPDLSATQFVAGYDFVENDTHPNDDEGHGTHVAGTVAGSTNNGTGVAGIAYGASIMPVKVLNSRGSGTYADIADGVRWAADNGADVINLSLGGSSKASYLEDALRYAYEHGVTIVAAAGNSGDNEALYPAGYDEYVIAVGATRYDETLAPYSNYGSAIDVVAPGGDLGVDQNGDGYSDGILQQTMGRRVDDFGYYFYQGTSMATPHVAGVAALIISSGTATTPDGVRNVLESTAKDLGAPGRDNTYGWGLINAGAAVSAAPAPEPEPQPEPEPADNPPTVSITNPNTGETVNNTVLITANASDDNSVDAVAFYVNNALLLTDTNAPYEASWDTTGYENNNYIVRATATDSASQTASDSISVTVENIAEEPPAEEPPSNTGAFTDSFENGEWDGNWTEDNQGVWGTTIREAIDGRHSAEVTGESSDAALTSEAIDMSGYTSATITFEWFLERRVDRNEYIAFDVSTDGGATWTEYGRLEGNSDPEDTWISFNATVPSTDALRLRFRGTMSRRSESAYVDNISVTGQ